ncbi:DNA replication complex GINS protein SLD5-like [Clavelina lepadiformis]|uniref:DNA replication complex GINS protein SLD5 n=1 Tax=Clavelina lepadiformis TaxID=159417 RepID=A0ABP0FQJ1_CLALP
MDDLLNVSGVSNDDSDEEHLTAAQVLEKLEQAWMNERLSPNLMECKSQIVEIMLEQIEEMEANIQRAQKGDLKISLHRLELDRIRYVVSSYLRCRLEKIEKFAPILLEREKSKSDDEPSKLSPEEFAFAKELVGNVDNHFKSSALKHMPRNLQNIALHEITSRPNLDHYVFLRVHQREEGVIVDPETDDHAEDRVDLEVGAQHLMRYQPIEQLVENGAVSLI